MGVGELLASSLHGTAVSLMNTGRPYFLKSVYLLNQFRALQLRCIERRREAEDLDDLVDILKQIELVLKKAGDKNDCMVTNNEVDQAFRDVDKVIKDYLASHPSDLPTGDFETVSVADSEATKHLRKVTKDNQKKLSILRNLKTIKFNMYWWSDIVRTKQGWNMVLSEFRIEKEATLDVCLLRILECQPPPESKKFLLTQNPQLYGDFAYGQGHFQTIAQTQIGRDDIYIEENQSKSVIYPLHLWWSVEEVVGKSTKTLHLLGDPVESIGRKEKYTNHWILEDYYVVQRRALTGALVLGPPSQNPITPITNSSIISVSRPSLSTAQSGSSTTLVPPANALTTSLPKSAKKKTPHEKKAFEHTSNAYSSMDMQTVEAEPQEEGGFRGWFKKKLGKYAT